MKYRNYYFVISLVILCFLMTQAICLGNGVNDFQTQIDALIDEKNVDASKLKAILKLEKLGERRAVPYIIQVLETPDFPYRFDAIHALASLGSNDALVFLRNLWKDLSKKNVDIAITEDEDTIISESAFVAAALYKLGDHQHEKYLYKTIKNDSKTVRYNVAIALGMVNNEESENKLFQILKNDKMDLPVCGALKALAEHGGYKVDGIKDKVNIHDDILKDCFVIE